MESHLIVALDMESMLRAEAMVDTLIGHIKYFKIGSQLFTAAGPRAIEMVKKKGGKVFLDLKLCDIPKTVAGAVKAAQSHNVFSISIHTVGGVDMIRQAVGLRPRPLLWGVTVLTSLDQDDLSVIGISKKVRETVLDLASMAVQEGVDGIICSPQEVSLIREKIGRVSIITPGIRMPETIFPRGEKKIAGEDQKRIFTPHQAVLAGANYLVVGRPITEARDPLQMTNIILREMGAIRFEQ